MELPKTLFIDNIRTETCDEWYGIDVRFRWPEDFDYQAHSAAEWEEERKWFDEHPHMGHVGLWPMEDRLQRSVVALIVASPEFAAFYQRSHIVRCEEYEDGPQRQIRIPRFTHADDYSDWNFDAHGGWISASDR